MNLTEELLGILNNDGELFEKRLILADNVLRSFTRVIENQESLILRWLLNHLDHKKHASWKKLLLWLESGQFNNISLNATVIEDWNLLMKVILKSSKKVKDKTFKETISKISLKVLENEIVQFLTRVNIVDYCNLFFATLEAITDANLLIDFLQKIFLQNNRDVISNVFFLTYFIQQGIRILTLIQNKFKDNKMVLESISMFIGKCIFQSNKKQFDNFYSTLVENSQKSEDLVPKLLFDELRSVIISRDVHSRDIFELVFYTYNKSIGKNFGRIYIFFIIVVDMLGFPQDLLHKSEQQSIDISKEIDPNCNDTNKLEILSVIFNILATSNIQLDSQVKSVAFETFIEDFLVSLLKVVKYPSDEMCNIFISASLIVPLSFEKQLDTILPYFLFTTKNEKLYPQLLNNIIDIFYKLQRIQNFISKTIKLMKLHLCNSEQILINDEYVINNLKIEDMFPKEVLNHFTNYISTLSSWQIMNILKTLIFHLKEATDFFQESDADFRFVLYTEIISTFMCLLLTTARISERTVSPKTVNNFLAGMTNIQEILSGFGSTLLKQEHNPRLIRAYLNMCYNWADLLIVMRYYLGHKESYFELISNNDNSASNITYVHPYLTTDEWCLISERITNFGEAPCKKIMHKLTIQKLKALFLFEENISEEVQANVTRALTSVIADSWEDLLSDRFILNEIIPNFDKVTLLSLGEILLKDFLKNKHLVSSRCSKIVDCSPIVSAVVYTTLSKISSLFREKGKPGEKQKGTYVFFGNFPFELFFLDNNESIDTLDILFNSFNSNVDLHMKIRSNLNEKKLMEYLDIFNKLPILFLTSEIETVLFLYFIMVLLELKEFDSPIREKCEDILIGLQKNGKIKYDRIPNINIILQIVFNYTNSYIDAFTCLLQYLLKSAEEIKPLENVVTFLLENKENPKCLQLIPVAIRHMSKVKKSKVEVVWKNKVVNCQYKLFCKLTELINEEDIIQPHFVEIFSLILKNCLERDDKDSLEKLTPKIEKYINKISLDRYSQFGYIKLFTLLLRNQNKIAQINDFMPKIWSFYKIVELDSNICEEYFELMILLFEHIPNEEFGSCSEELLKMTINSFNNIGTEKTRFLKLWNIMLDCNLNAVKSQIAQEKLEKVFKLILSDVTINVNTEIVLTSLIELELNVIKSVQFFLSGPLVDFIFVSATLLMTKADLEFTKAYILSSSVLENLLKFRKFLVFDRLPSFLQILRILLSKLCTNSNAELQESKGGAMSDCAYILEKLISTLCFNGKYVARISPYLIADILREYEQTTIVPGVKFHLNNCLYKLFSVCDQHAILYCMRLLSSSSTELFKVAYQNYKKYYKFTGKV